MTSAPKTIEGIHKSGILGFKKESLEVKRKEHP
jgi:hypothetical protein